MLRSIRRAIAIVGLSPLLLVGALAAPTSTLASCLPIDMRPMAADPGTVVFVGKVAQLTPTQVGFEVARWWGDGPQAMAIVERPPQDPAVISSTDWDPKVGEDWIIFATRHGASLVTEACGQMPVTADGIAQVESKLGPGATGAPTDPPDAAPTGGSSSPGGLGWPAAVLAIGGLLLIAGGFVLARRRRG